MRRGSGLYHGSWRDHKRVLHRRADLTSATTTPHQRW